MFAYTAVVQATVLGWTFAFPVQGTVDCVAGVNHDALAQARDLFPNAALVVTDSVVTDLSPRHPAYSGRSDLDPATYDRRPEWQERMREGSEYGN